MQIIILWKIWYHQETLVSAAQVHTAIVSDPVVEIWAKSLFQFIPTLYRDHENFGKSTIIFIQTFTKTLTILRVNKHFLGKFCVSILINDFFSFSIKMTVKYNIVLLVVN